MLVNWKVNFFAITVMCTVKGCLLIGRGTQQVKVAFAYPKLTLSLGAGFGEGITNDNRRFAADREPVVDFLIYGIASDIVEKWFKVNDPVRGGLNKSGVVFTFSKMI